MTIHELIEKNDGSRFQQKLYELIVSQKLTTVLETGSGVSSLFILKALEELNDGVLYSIDPSMWFSDKIEHSRFNLFEQLSEDALVDIAVRAGSFDLCVSDGDHDIKAQTYEYFFMYGCLKPNGYLVADDATWGGHNAWQKFCATHGLKEQLLGDARFIQKPSHIPVFDNLRKYHQECLMLAKTAEKNWLDAGNKNSDIQWVRV